MPALRDAIPEPFRNAQFEARIDVVPNSAVSNANESEICFTYNNQPVRLVSDHFEGTGADGRSVPVPLADVRIRVKIPDSLLTSATTGAQISASTTAQTSASNAVQTPASNAAQTSTSTTEQTSASNAAQTNHRDLARLQSCVYELGARLLHQFAASRSTSGAGTAPDPQRVTTACEMALAPVSSVAPWRSGSAVAASNQGTLSATHIVDVGADGSLAIRGVTLDDNSREGRLCERVLEQVRLRLERGEILDASGRRVVLSSQERAQLEAIISEARGGRSAIADRLRTAARGMSDRSVSVACLVSEAVRILTGH